MLEEQTGKVETQQQTDPTTQPKGSQEKPVSSQEKPDAQGVIVGLKAQLGREKDKTKSLEARIAALETSSASSEEDGLGWQTEGDAEKSKKELSSLQKKLREALDARLKSDREIQTLKLSQKHGIPYEVLSDARNEMELLEKVTQWYSDKKSEEKPASSPFETGNVAPSPEKPVFEMSAAEFDEYDKRVKAEARARKLR